MSSLRRAVLHNWHLKLVALAISFLLWASYTAEPLAEAGYVVPLVFLNLPAGCNLSGDVPTQVHVVLRGRAALLRRVLPADVRVSVDLAGRPPGEHSVRLTTAEVDVPLGVEKLRIFPNEIKVRLEARAAP